MAKKHHDIKIKRNRSWDDKLLYASTDIILVLLLLIVIIMMQSGKEAGLGAITGNSDSYMSKNGKGGMDKMLASATKWVALVWVFLTLVLALMA